MVLLFCPHLLYLLRYPVPSSSAHLQSGCAATMIADGGPAAEPGSNQQTQQDVQQLPLQQQPAVAAPLPLLQPEQPAPPLPPQVEAATIVRQACDLLALPPRVTSTALTYMHRLQPEGELPAEVRGFL